MQAKKWCVIGAGVAGITAVAKLLDHGVSGANIYWVSRDFEVGDLGLKWRRVSSNTTVKRLKDFLNGSELFKEVLQERSYKIFRLEDENDTCSLKRLVKPLKAISERLECKVNTYQGQVERVDSEKDIGVKLTDGKVLSVDKVIVATGAEPKAPLYDSVETVSLEVALDPKLLHREMTRKDTVAVFGSSHSAVLVLHSLSQSKAKKILHFSRQPLRYAVETDQGIIYDNTGLKGLAASWAKSHLETSKVKHLQHFDATPENIQRHLPQATKAIYAIGFDRRDILINGQVITDYDTTTGEIKPNIYGFGIAYPDLKQDLSGEHEWQVGVVKFLKQINQQLPNWMA